MPSQHVNKQALNLYNWIIIIIIIIIIMVVVVVNYCASPHNIIPHPRWHRKPQQIKRKYVLSFDITTLNKVHVDTEIDNTIHGEKTDLMT